MKKFTNSVVDNKIKYLVKSIEFDSDGISTKIRRRQGNNYLDFWLDSYERDGEVITDWNQYIFDLANNEDLMRKSIQENSHEFDIMTSLVETNLYHMRLMRDTQEGTCFTFKVLNKEKYLQYVEKETVNALKAALNVYTSIEDKTTSTLDEKIKTELPKLLDTYGKKYDEVMTEGQDCGTLVKSMIEIKYVALFNDNLVLVTTENKVFSCDLKLEIY